ncbi:MAG: AraC family transcriptional regulator [Cyanobacteria bacterium REEB459]|nr:AraC family transcriptional regulator [Cyanobacteria bacterium REEB459]
MDAANPFRVNLEDAASLTQVFPVTPTVVHWPADQGKVIMLHYDQLAPDSIAEYQPCGHSVLTLFHLDDCPVAVPVVRADRLAGEWFTHRLLHPATAQLCPDGVAHAAVWYQPLKVTSFCFTTAFLNQVGQSAFDGQTPELIPRSQICDDSLYHLAMVMKGELGAPVAEQTGPLFQAEMMFAMAIYLLKNYGARPWLGAPAQALDNRAMASLGEYIHANLHTEISLEPLATSLGLGELALCQGFLTRTGRTLHQFVQWQRQTKALWLLAVSSLCREEIAQQCGYDDVLTMALALRQGL